VKSERENCAFFDGEYCSLDDFRCKGKCKRYVRKRDTLSWKDHYDIFVRRSEKRTDLLIRWISVAIAIAGLTIAVVTNLDKMRSPRQDTKVTGTSAAAAAPSAIGTPGKHQEEIKLVPKHLAKP
jgi:hypothetical protein